MTRLVVDALEEKKGEDILLIDIHEIADFTDYFILCSGSSVRMLDALAEEVVTRVKSQYSLGLRIEGQPEDGWLVVDLGDVVVHLFTPDQRDYYKLEQLWAEGKVLLHLV